MEYDRATANTVHKLIIAYEHLSGLFDIRHVSCIQGESLRDFHIVIRTTAKLLRVYGFDVNNGEDHKNHFYGTYGHLIDWE